MAAFTLTYAENTGPGRSATEAIASLRSCAILRTPLLRRSDPYRDSRAPSRVNILGGAPPTVLASPSKGVSLAGRYTLPQELARRAPEKRFAPDELRGACRAAGEGLGRED